VRVCGMCARVRVFLCVCSRFFELSHARVYVAYLCLIHLCLIDCRPPKSGGSCDDDDDDDDDDFAGQDYRLFIFVPLPTHAHNTCFVCSCVVCVYTQHLLCVWLCCVCIHTCTCVGVCVCVCMCVCVCLCVIVCVRMCVVKRVCINFALQ